MIKARVIVFLKSDVMDPQGEAVEHALASLGHKGIQKVRVGRAFDLELADSQADQAEAEVKKMCESLLANMVIEKYEITFDTQGATA